MQTEKQMRESSVPSLNTEEELVKYIHALVERKHDYGTCVYAMSMAAVAAFNYVAGKLGVTGFQASCADLDILRRTRDLKDGFRILDYNKLLYPQFLDDDHFPSWHDLIRENAGELKKKAKKLLRENKMAHPDVIAHWKMLANLCVDLPGKEK